MLIFKRYILILLISLFSLPSFARDRKEEHPFELHRHEFAVSGAVFPGRYAFGYDSGFEPRVFSYPYYSSVLAQYQDASTYNKEKVTDTWTVSYTYNFSRIFALTAGLSYEGGWNEYYSREDDSRLSVFECHYFTPMLTARFSWFNRNLVRLYSSVGAGMAFSRTCSRNTGEYESDTHFSLQVTPVGISVGRRFFGFFELGAGTIYLGGCFGLGYRF